MRFAILAAGLLLASGSAQAHSEGRHSHIGCDIGSNYSVREYRSAFLFSKDDGEPAEIGIGGGRLFIDGKEVSLSKADQQRLGHLETEMHLLVPEMRQIAVEDIAFTALTEVARGLSKTPEATISELESAHQRMRREMVARPLSAFNDDAMGDVIKPIITKFIPDIVGGAVSSALSAAFGGDKKATEFERKMTHMERELDTKVEKRADKLEPLADAMCKRLRRMDELDDALEYRQPNGEALELLRVDRYQKD
jgi:hypothetical protein